jgi:ADP-ribose pyrophosphatase YjhB (NUDIX family)
MALPTGAGTMNAGDPAFMRQGPWKRLRDRMFHLWLGVRGVVYDEATNSVFLIRHTYVPGWQFPGGGVERGETMLESLGRELSEEGNIELRSTPILKSLHYNRRQSPRDHVALYLVTDFAQTAPKKPDIEIAEAGFFPLDALPEETSPATRRRIAELFKGEPASPEW